MKFTKSMVFKAAWAMNKETGIGFNVCLVKAWESYRIINNPGTQFMYIKESTGELRNACCSDYDYQPKPGASKRKPAQANNIRYFDVSAQGIRSFKLQNLI